MKKRITRALPIVLLGGVFALWSCEKVAPSELSPKPVQANQVVATPNPAGKPSPAQAAWLRFVDRVERGEIVDPSGQYVAKGTKAVVDADGHHIKRPKFSAGTKAFTQHYELRNNGKTIEVTAFASPITSQAPPIDPSCTYCPSPPPAPTATSTFVSSVNLGGNGDIYDLKLVADTGYTLPENEIPQPGYSKLNSDLNKGAGGDYIYFTFTRNATDIKYYGPIGSNYQYGPLTYFSIVTRPYLYQSGVPWPTDHAPIWFINYNITSYNTLVYIEELDLNKGCGWVDMVYAHQSKNAAFGSPIREVGVLSGNSDSIQPPIGWTKVGVDLNKEAGGNYIYLCFKR